MLEKMHQRFSAVHVNCIFIVCFLVVFFSPPGVYQQRVFVKPFTTSLHTVRLYIESYFWFCQKSIHRHKDIAIQPCTSVCSTCLAAKHQNSVSILFNVSVLTQRRKQPFIVLAERPYPTASCTCSSNSAILLHLHDDLCSSGIFTVEA